jgi:hypothetical protein
MVYILHKFFGSDGRDEAEDLLRRRSGDVDNPRILSAFNKPVSDWLTFFCFTTFTDRDGKYQLAALAESGFDPLARTTQFMLTEEAHHLSVGENGVGRIVQRTAELMKEGTDPRKVGAIPLDILQRYYSLIAGTGGSYLWYYPEGQPGISGPETLATDGWGSSAMLAALIEGVAGITDEATRFEPAADIHAALKSTDITDHIIIGGPIQFDAKGQNNNIGGAMLQNQNGTPVVVLPAASAEAKPVFPLVPFDKR